MALLAVAKLLVAALAFGSGTPGGLFAPTLFLGVMLGGTFAGSRRRCCPSAGPQSTLVLAGMAGVFAGVFRAPMTAVFMAFELSGTSASIVPAMITSTLGYLTARQLHRTSLLDLVAEDEGAVLPSSRLRARKSRCGSRTSCSRRARPYWCSTGARPWPNRWRPPTPPPPTYWPACLASPGESSHSTQSRPWQPAERLPRPWHGTRPWPRCPRPARRIARRRAAAARRAPPSSPSSRDSTSGTCSVSSPSTT